MLPDASKPTVAHFVRTWLALTETFIYQYVSHLRRLRPVVLCTETSNLAQFPVSPLVVCSRPRRGTLLWAACGLARRALGWPAADAVVCARIAAAIRQYNPALMHAHFADVAVLVSPVCRRLKLPLVTSFYGCDASISELVERNHAHYLRLFEEGALFLVEGPVMQERVAALGCPREKIRIQHVAIDLSRIPFRPRRLPEGDGPLRVLFVGRFVEKKGLLGAIAAFKAADGKSPHMHLRIVGDGPLRAQVEALIAELGLTERVCLLGYLRYEQMLKELARAHILLAPSKTASNGDSEGGAPTILLEAQASGLPIVATDHADIPYVVGDGAALLAPEGDVECLARHLRNLASDAERWPAMGRAGRAHVERHHSIRPAVGRLEGWYAEVLRSIKTAT